MPCVCLANTFKQWETFKALKSQSSKQLLTERHSANPSSAAIAPAIRLTEDTSVRVPHTRAKICQHHALGGTPIVQDFASEIISMSPKPANSTRTTAKPAKTARTFSKLAAKIAKTSPKPAKLTKISAKLAGANVKTPAPMTRAELINAESKLGSALFGPIPEGHRREFFHDQNNVWIWHENWQDSQHGPRQMTVRYEVRTSGIYKKISAGKYFKLEGDELENFRKATHAYLFMIKKYLYNKQPSPKAA